MVLTFLGLVDSTSEANPKPFQVSCKITLSFCNFVLTEAHIIESLSRAYIRAVAGKAGLNLSIREYDYGVDGNFDEIAIHNNRRVESGFSLSFQLKASTQWQRDENTITYDLEAKTYNDLVIRRNFRMAVPCILILFALPPDASQWLTQDEDEMRLRGSCYWEYISGKPTTNRQSVRIRIPRQQKLTPESLLGLIEKVKTGDW